MSDGSSVVLVEPDPWGQAVSSRLEAFQPYRAIDDNLRIQGTSSAGATEMAKEAYRKDEALDLAKVRSQTQDVGRPVLGVLTKPNTHAFVQVIGADGSTIQCFNNIGWTHQPSGYYLADMQERDTTFKTFSALADNPVVDFFSKKEEPVVAETVPGTAKSSVWTDWILQSVQEARIEKTQVVETFGDSYFYAYGQRPRSIAFSGLLMNTLDYNWRSIFWKNWDEYFRATKLVQRSARLYIQWDNIIVEGYPINAVCSEVSDSPNALKFSFQLFVTRYIDLSAQSGFLMQQYMKIAQLRSGSGLGMIDKTQGFRLLGGESFNPKSFNYINPNDPDAFFGTPGGGMFGMEGLFGLRSGSGAQFEKFSLWGQAGPTLGNSIKRAALSNKTIREAYETTELGRSLVNSLGYATSALQKHARMADGQKAKVFMNDFLRQLVSSNLEAIASDIQNLAEDAMNVRRGEIDQWFGEVANLMADASNDTTKGQGFKLSPAAQYSSVSRAVTTMVGGWFDDPESKWNSQPGGIVIVGEDNTNISFATQSAITGGGEDADFTVGEISGGGEDADFTVGEISGGGEDEFSF